MQQIQIFQSSDGDVSLEGSLEQETVWLSLDQMVSLFERDKSVISRHIRNVFREGELERQAVVAKNATTAADGKTYQVDYFNLDVSISVGYRVKSQRGVQFRKLATSVLKQHLVEGYTLNRQRLEERGVEREQAVALLSRTLANQGLVAPVGEAVLRVIDDYARSWSLIQGYDDQSLAEVSGRQVDMCPLSLEDARDGIAALKRELVAKGEASELFGQLRGEGLASALATIEQGFGDELFYPNAASRAAHLLYLVIKNHPFADGNKRIGSFLIPVVFAPEPDSAGPARDAVGQRLYPGGPGVAGGGEPAGPEVADDPADRTLRAAEIGTWRRWCRWHRLGLDDRRAENCRRVPGVEPMCSATLKPTGATEAIVKQAAGTSHH